MDVHCHYYSFNNSSYYSCRCNPTLEEQGGCLRVFFAFFEFSSLCRCLSVSFIDWEKHFLTGHLVCVSLHFVCLFLPFKFLTLCVKFGIMLVSFYKTFSLCLVHAMPLWIWGQPFLRRALEVGSLNRMR